MFHRWWTFNPDEGVTVHESEEQAAAAFRADWSASQDPTWRDQLLCGELVPFRIRRRKEWLKR